MKIRSAVPQNGYLILLTDGKKTEKSKQKNKKNRKKHLQNIYATASSAVA